MTGMPKRFLGCRFDSYRAEGQGQQAAKDAARAVVDGSISSLIFTGGVGTGKTHLAAAAIHEWEDEAFRQQARRGIAAYVTADGLMREIKDSWSQREVTEEEILDRYLRAGLLVIDEVGAGVGSDTETRYLSHVIGRRYDLERPVLVISNLSMGTIKERGIIDERAIDRLREIAQLVVFDWESERGKRRAGEQ